MKGRDYKNFRKKRKAQVTIFIILALIILVLIAMVFLIWKKPEIGVAPSDDPQKYIESCTKEAVEEAIDILGPKGGSINPRYSKLYKDIPRRILCYTNSYYKSCVHQEPLLVEHIEEEITQYIEPKIESCFQSLKEEMEKRNYDVEIGGMLITTQLKPKKVVVEIERNFKITKNQETQGIDIFKTQIISPIYELANIALEIINQEALYCNFEYIGHMVFYPKFEIEKFVAGDSTKIYTIREVLSEKEFVFGVRGCVVPPGF